MKNVINKLTNKMNLKTLKIKIVFTILLLTCVFKINAFSQTEHWISKEINGVTYKAYYLEWWDDNNNFWVQLEPKGMVIGSKNLIGVKFRNMKCGTCGKRITDRNVTYADWVGRNFLHCRWQ